MSYVATLVDRVFILRWIAPVVEDVDRLNGELERAAAAARRRLIFVAVVDGATLPPSNETRARLNVGFKQANESCEFFHFVVTSRGFVHSAHRAIMLASILVSGRRGHNFVSSSLREAVTKTPVHTRAELAAGLATAEQRGIVSAGSVAPPADHHRSPG